MDLKELYSLRRDFTVIGLTGRTGSGCTKVAKLLSDNIDNLKNGLRRPKDFGDTIFSRKYKACYDFINYGNNWQPFTMISYKDVLLFFIMSKYGNNYDRLKNLFDQYFQIDKSDDNKSFVAQITDQFFQIHRDHKDIIERIDQYDSDFSKIRTDTELEQLENDFFGLEFTNFKKEVFKLLESVDYKRRTEFLHHIACNIRACADPFKGESNIENIYCIANLVNRLIKAKKYVNGKNSIPTKIVIDSLRNSLEIMFFKERYSAFYMIACKDEINGARTNIERHLKEIIRDNEKRSDTVKYILELDGIEYRCKDFRKGKFSSPDVENCIQKSDIHILNRSLDDYKKERNDLSRDKHKKHEVERLGHQFYSTEEQLMKIVSLIHQPGIVTPSASERCMQIAHSSKLNSGCISRQVGAVVTDKAYSVKSVGWNDVPRGTTSCKLRSYEEYRNNTADAPHFSDFELSKPVVKQAKTSYKYKGKDPGDFRSAIKYYYEDSYEMNHEHLNGKKCSFCFKTVHNFYEGESNQVHTKSLHAEENAMLQISKNGGQPLRNGYLFTTASPCELCAKKAYQLGITKIFYIDPYPGISQSHIIHNGVRDNIPAMLPFNGVIGKAYEKLYEPFMSYKDEVSMMLDLKPRKREGILKENIVDFLDDSSEGQNLKNLLKKNDITDNDILTAIKNHLAG